MVIRARYLFILFLMTCAGADDFDFVVSDNLLIKTLRVCYLPLINILKLNFNFFNNEVFEALNILARNEWAGSIGKLLYYKISA